VAGAYTFRVLDLESLKEITQKKAANEKFYSRHDTLSSDDIEVITKLLSYLETLDLSAWTKRVERSCIDIYTNDQEIFNDISEKFNDIVIHRFEPFEGSLEYLDVSSTIIGKKLPHDRYKYRVYLLPHKLANDKEAKQRFVEWIKNQSPRITCTPAVEQWFIKTNWNWDRRYVLVEDEQTLLMLKLRNSDVVGKIYNYVVCDK
jgi:hypothetical protein